NENYGKQVYDHYLAMDSTVNVVSAQKASLLTDWVKQWQEAVDQGQSCTVQGNTQVSPPVVDQYEIGQSSIDQNPNVNVCGYYYLPGGHAGDVAQTIKDLQDAGVKVYKLDQAVTAPAAHQFGQFNINAVQGQGSPDLTQTVTLSAGTLYIPLAQGPKHWIQAVLGEHPYLPFNYFYDTGAALVSGSSIDLPTLNSDAATWETPVYGLSSYPVGHYALGLPKIAVYTGGTAVPTNPAFHGTGDGQCTSRSYCEVMFALTQ